MPMRAVLVVPPRAPGACMVGKREVALELDMLATDAGPRSPSPSPLSGSIRNAAQRDLPAVARLLEASGIDVRSIEPAPNRSPPHCHLLVLDIDGDVRAIAHVVIALDRGLRGRLQFLVLDPTLVRASGPAIQDRMIGVSVALCEAYGCAEIDIAATSRDDVAAARQVRVACAG